MRTGIIVAVGATMVSNTDMMAGEEGQIGDPYSYEDLQLKYKVVIPGLAVSTEMENQKPVFTTAFVFPK